MAVKKKELPTIVPQIFEHEQFGKVRIVVIDGKPWFVAVDLCRALGYTNSRKALADHVDDEDKNTVTIRYGIPGNPNMTVINESGMYALIFGSQLPAAKKFKRWVTNEVLPSIRETGSYSVPQAKKKKELPPLPPDIFNDDPTDFGNLARLEMFLEENGIEYDYDVKLRVIKDKDGNESLCYCFEPVIKNY